MTKIQFGSEELQQTYGYKGFTILRTGTEITYRLFIDGAWVTRTARTMAAAERAIDRYIAEQEVEKA